MRGMPSGIYVTKYDRGLKPGLSERVAKSCMESIKYYNAFFVVS